MQWEGWKWSSVCVRVSRRGPAAASLAIKDNVGFSDGTELCEHLFHSTCLSVRVCVPVEQNSLCDMRAQRSVVAVFFLGGERGLFQGVLCVQWQRGEEWEGPHPSSSSHAPPHQSQSSTQIADQHRRTYHSRKNTEEVVALKLKPRI
jgi:hypothetical protein